MNFRSITSVRDVEVIVSPWQTLHKHKAHHSARFVRARFIISAMIISGDYIAVLAPGVVNLQPLVQMCTTTTTHIGRMRCFDFINDSILLISLITPDSLSLLAVA